MHRLLRWDRFKDLLKHEKTGEQKEELNKIGAAWMEQGRS